MKNMKKPTKPSKRGVARSASTGKFVSKAEAKANPKTTVVEKRKG